MTDEEQQRRAAPALSASMAAAMASTASSAGAVALEPSTTPRFSVRFVRGATELTLSQPLAFDGGTLRTLVLDLGAAPRVTDFSRGWRALANRRATVISLELALDPRWLGLDVAAGDGWRLLSVAAGRLLVERRRPWGHVAMELLPILDRGTEGGPEGELVLVPVGARSFLPGPGAPISEVEDVARAMARAAASSQRPGISRDPGPHFVAARGGIVVGDVLRDALTDALVPHGMRVPELGVAQRSVRLSGMRGLVLAVGGEAPDAAAARELGRAIAPLLSRVSSGASVSELASLAAARLPVDTAAAFGAPVPPDAVGIVACHAALTTALDAGTPAEIQSAAQRLDAEERAPGVATDALLAAMARLSGDLPRARDLAARALTRSPARPDVIASCLELSTASADPAEARRLLRDLERRQREASQRADPWIDVALARADEQLGDHDAALERWERAVRSPLTVPETFEGLARQLVRRGRLSEALHALDRAVELYTHDARATAANRCALAAARIALRSGEPRAAALRLQVLEHGVLEDGGSMAADPAQEVERLALSGRVHRAQGDRAAAERDERDLMRLVDLLGMEAPEEAIAALLETARSSMGEGDGARADAFIDVVNRARPGDARGEELRAGELAAILLSLESSESRAAVARKAADALRARSRMGDAARVLARAGELERDVTLLRVALDLSEREGDRALFTEILDRTLAIVGDGPARAALLARRFP